MMPWLVAYAERPASVWRRAAGGPAAGLCWSRSGRVCWIARLTVVRVTPSSWASSGEGRGRGWCRRVARTRAGRGLRGVVALAAGGGAAGVGWGGPPGRGGGGGGGGGLEDALVAGQRPAPPVHRDRGEQPVLDPVPLGGAGREVTHRDAQPGL